MNNKRLLFLGMVALTLGIGVILGSIVSGGVKATFEQKAAAIAIPDPVSLSNTFSQIAAQLDPAVVKITVKTKPAPAQPAEGSLPSRVPGVLSTSLTLVFPTNRWIVAVSAPEPGSLWTNPASS